MGQAGHLDSSMNALTLWDAAMIVSKVAHFHQLQNMVLEMKKITSPSFILFANSKDA